MKTLKELGSQHNRVSPPVKRTSLPHMNRTLAVEGHFLCHFEQNEANMNPIKIVGRKVYPKKRLPFEVERWCRMFEFECL